MTKQSKESSVNSHTRRDFSSNKLQQTILIISAGLRQLAKGVWVCHSGGSACSIALSRWFIKTTSSSASHHQLTPPPCFDIQGKMTGYETGVLGIEGESKRGNWIYQGSKALKNNDLLSVNQECDTVQEWEKYYPQSTRLVVQLNQIIFCAHPSRQWCSNGLIAWITW